jgi:hypothetical protein
MREKDENTSVGKDTKTLYYSAVLFFFFLWEI